MADFSFRKGFLKWDFEHLLRSNQAIYLEFHKLKTFLNLISHRYLTAPQSFIHRKNHSLIPNEYCITTYSIIIGPTTRNAFYKWMINSLEW